jgi:hypothetical protein
MADCGRYILTENKRNKLLQCSGVCNSFPLYIVLRSQEVFKYHHHQQGARHHEKLIGISILVLMSNMEREREREREREESLVLTKPFVAAAALGREWPLLSMSSFW